jgi:prophage regulatory protein
MKVLSYPELRALKGIRFSRQWIAKLVTDGKFPKPVKLGAATNGYIEAEIDAWIEARAAERTTPRRRVKTA